MFTEEQIKQAHSKVKSGADFPAYIAAIKLLGVTAYDMRVVDGRVNYSGAEDFTVAGAAKYAALPIADSCDAGQFKTDLKAHQQGQTDYLTFIADCAKSGIEKWVVRMEDMTCTYYDKAGEEVLVERIPG